MIETCVPRYRIVQDAWSRHRHRESSRTACAVHARCSRSRPLSVEYTPLRVFARIALCLAALSSLSTLPSRDVAPSARAHHALAYDPTTQRVLLTAGSTPRDGGRRFEFFNDLWAFDGRRWTELATSGDRISGTALAFDARRDTWAYDGQRWVRQDVPGPVPRMSAGATYDSRRGIVVIFGGSSGDGFLGDTWGWNGRGWRRLADTGPERRAMGQLAYDAARDRIVLFGGRRGWPDGDLSDTWEWNGTAWSRFGD